MRFKCVQKSWNALFKTHAFAIRNMKINKSNDKEHNHFVIIDQCTKNTCPEIHNHCTKQLDENVKATCLETNITFLSLLDKPTPTLTPYLDINSLFQNNNLMGIIKLYGHCNGVLCLESYQYDRSLCLILWNPTPREVHYVPPPSSSSSSSSIHQEALIGFGAAPNTNNFKVVKLNIDREIKFAFSLLSVEFYNLNNKSWTIIHNPILPPNPADTRYYSQRPNKYNVFVNGIYYWNIGYNYEGFAIILSFDFSNNMFHSLEGPVSRVHPKAGPEQLVEINGSLAYVVKLLHMSKFGIWMMGEHGWTKIYNLDRLHLNFELHAIWKGKSGVQYLAGIDGQHLTLYDLQGNSLHKFPIIIRKLVDAFLVHDYVQSIAPF